MHLRHLVRVSLTGSMVVAALTSRAAPVEAQVPAAARDSGQTVTPAFEGWYKNPDGSYSLSFGYYNRNTREALEIPIGPQNFMSPGAQNQGQPTRFEVRRDWGVFAVRVPADFGAKTVTWTLSFRGQTYAIPGSLKQGWEIDAIQGEASSGNKPPVLKFDAVGAEGTGPAGITSPTKTVAVGTPLTLEVWAADDGKGSSSISSDGRPNASVTLRFLKHQGPGQVTFGTATPMVDRATGKATTTATFSAPGEYIIRIRANDASGTSGAGHAQCCWSNAFVKVTVTR